MPRTYMFTILLTALITAFLYHAVEFMKIEPYEIILVLCMSALLYVNEKTAFFENMISGRVRRFLGGLALVGIVGMVVLIFLFYK